MRGLPNFAQTSPWYGQGVVFGGGKAGKAPTPPDPKATAAAQTQSNVETATANAILANQNQYTPWGSIEYNQTGTKRIGTGNAASSGPGAALGVTTNAAGQQGYDIPVYESRITLSPEQQQILDAENRANLGMTNLAADYTGRIADATARPFSYEGMPGAPIYDENFRRQQLDTIMQRAQPTMDRERASLEQQLANQGITLGSEAWRNAQDDLGRRQNDFRLAADTQAGNEAARIFGLQGSARDRAVQEALTQRNQPLNEVASLLGSGGVSMPQFQPTPQVNMQGTDVAGIYQNDYQNRLAAWQAKQQQSGGILGGLFGLAGAGLGGWARGGFKF